MWRTANAVSSPVTPIAACLERHLLLLGGVRRVVGRDAVDRPVAQALDQRLAVVLGAQRRVHLEAGVEAADRLVGEGQVVRRRLAGDLRRPRPWRARSPRPRRARRGAGRGSARPRRGRAQQSRAIIVDSETAGIPASPSAAETSPSCITPSPERSGSSSWSAITPPARRWYWSARRSTRAFAIGRPSSEKPTAPASRELGHLGQLLARHPPGDVGDEADRDRRLALGALAHRAEHRGRVDRRRGVRHRDHGAVAAGRGRARCRSRGPPCAPGPGTRRWTWGSTKAGNASSPSPSTTSAPSISGRASRLGELGDLPVADDEVASGVEVRCAGRSRRAPRMIRVAGLASGRPTSVHAHAGCPIVGVSAGAGPRSGRERSVPASSS